jgi:hypothetical protein
MENHKSWINNYSKFDLSELSQKLINNIIISLNNKNLIKADDFEFSNKEIDLIYRWSLYVSSSTFLERLIKIINKKIFKKNKIKKNINYFYNLNSLDFSYNYYNNSDLNARLINDIIGIFSSENIEIKPDSINTQKNKNFFFQKNYTINGLKNFIKRNYYKLNFLTKSEKYIYENCIWLNAIFKKKQIIKDIGSNEYEINKKFRSQLRECFKKEFIKTLNNKIFHEIKLSEQTKNNLSKLFSFWVDCSIPKSLIEGINFKLNFYKKYIQNKKIKFVHVCTGIYANDNIKLLCLLCKRNKIKIIGHDHGINNFVSFYNKENNKLNFYKGLFQFYYEDIFFSWGQKNWIFGIKLKLRQI